MIPIIDKLFGYLGGNRKANRVGKKIMKHCNMRIIVLGIVVCLLFLGVEAKA